MTQQRPWISSRDGSAPNVERGLRRERQGEGGASGVAVYRVPSL